MKIQSKMTQTLPYPMNQEHWQILHNDTELPKNIFSNTVFDGHNKCHLLQRVTSSR